MFEIIMRNLFIKEFNAFFSSLIGYLIVSVFSLLMGFFVWLYPGDTNLLDNFNANLSTMFDMAPWVYLFLIPAISMRLFAEEKKTGTIELLMIRPLSEMKIILGKYFATAAVLLVSLLPCLFYFACLYFISNPVGNVDAGAFMCSFLGVFLLGLTYLAISVFSSSISDNEILSFIIGVLLCLFFYSGFTYLSSLDGLYLYQSEIINLGADVHYMSMSKGVIDSRDLVYFVAVIYMFLLFTKTVLKSRKW